MAAEPRLVILCGHYEGVDERIRQHMVTREISIGDYVLTGGELPALTLIDAVTRLQPGVLHDAASHQQDSFSDGLLDCPHYTRPEVWEGEGVPAALLSGHHAQIERWRRDQRLLLTARQRPDLLAAARAQGRLDAADERVLQSGRP